MSKANPYIAGNPVGGTEAFIGRADVLRDVLRVLRSEHENGMVLYGQRRIGKTSVLQELETVLPQQGNFAPVYFDLQDKAALSLDQVLTELANRILDTLDIPAADIPKENFSSVFQDIFLPHVLSHLPEQTSLVLLLDEFDVLDNPGNKQAGAAFFPYLRDLMAEDVKRLQFVFVIGRRPEDLSSVYLSLFKGVKSSHVSLMSEKDTADLVRLSEKNDSLKWTDDVAAEVYQLTGGHPFLTQQLCQVIWNNLYDDDPEEPPTVQPDDVNNAVQEAIRTATNSLEWLWNGLQPAQRIVASALAEAGPKLITQQELEKHLHDSGVSILIGELQDAPRVLAEWDVIQPEDGGYRMRVEMLRQWIAERKPLSRVRDEMDRILPAAENLFQAAYAFYQGGQLDDAEQSLRQAVRLNPNHIKANQLLAEILLARGNTDEALKILETLYEYDQSAAKPRFVQALLNKANEEKQNDKKIAFYEKILEIDHFQTEALAKCQKYYENKGELSLKNNDIEKALEFYKKAYDYNPIKFKSIFIKMLINKAKEKKSENKRYVAFYEMILELEPNQPEAVAEYKKIYERQGDIAYKANQLSQAIEAYKKADAIEKIEKISKLQRLYEDALSAFDKNEKQKAQRLLVEVISIEPSYKEATHYMHLVTKGSINSSYKRLKTIAICVFIFIVILSIGIITKNKIDNLNREIETNLSKIYQLSDDIKNKDIQIAKLTDKANRTISLDSEIENKTNKINELNNQITDKQSEISRLNIELGKSEKKRSEIGIELGKFEKKRSEIKTEIEKQQIELYEIEPRLIELKKQHGYISQLTAEIRILTAEKAKLNAELKKATELLEKTNENLNKPYQESIPATTGTSSTSSLSQQPPLMIDRGRRW